MAPVAAPKCQYEGCQNPTWHIYCHHHQGGASGKASTAAATIGSPATPTLNFLHYANVSDLWSDLLGAFPDAGDVVQPKTIRQEALDTLSTAVDAEAYRRFPSLDVPDYNEREALIAQMREQLVIDLLPEASHVTGSEARELSYSSADQYGRSAEDSRYLASFALNSEWECHRIMGQNVDASFEQFVQNGLPEMREAIDMSFRRNLSEFADIIRQTSGREPLNGNPVAPHLAIAPVYVKPENDVVTGQVVGSPVDDIAQWFNENRQYIDNPSQSSSVPPQPAQPPSNYYGQQIPNQQQYHQNQQQEETVMGGLWKMAKEKVKDYIEDPDGVHEANRLAARDRREQEARAAQKAKDEKLDRELKEQLLIQRKRRNRRW